MTTRTYRGRSLEELLPQVRAELGPDAVIVRQREGLTGGVGGFFQKRMVEIEATAGGADAPASIDVRDDTPATPDFLDQLSQAQAAAAEWGAGQDLFPADEPRLGGDELPAYDPAAFELPETLDDETWADWAHPVHPDADALPPAPEVRLS